MKNLKVLLLFLLPAGLASAQSPFPRVFWDIPAIYATTPNAEHVANRVGAGLETALNLGTHWGMLRIGGGSTFTLDPKADDIKESFLVNPYGLFKIGLGQFRTNGNQCARSRAKAFSAMATGGLIYIYDKRDLAPGDISVGGGFDYTAGVELGYFFIRDMFRNQEFFISGDYHVNEKVISASIGFKLFLNMRVKSLE